MVFETKYNAVPVLAVPYTLAFALTQAQNWPWRRIVGLAVLLPLLAAAAFVAGTPYSILSFDEFANALIWESQLQASGMPGGDRRIG